MCEHRKDNGKPVFINTLCRKCSTNERVEKNQLKIARKISEKETRKWTW